jgi:hypothetical protein
MEALPRFDRIPRLAGGEALLQRRIVEVRPMNASFELCRSR